MIFIAITFLAAFLIEGLGTYVSVIGLSTLFGANPIIIALAIALDMGKLVVVTLLYTYWKKLGKVMRIYAFIASAITMTITSAGAAGYLSGEFQKAILGTQEVGLKVDVLKKEQAKLEDRKKQIDAGIAAIPDRYTANQKIRLMAQFKDEQKQVTARLNEISAELPKMQITQIGVEAKAGPILYVAKAFDIPVESAVKWVILMIIFVFDPLAVFLIIAGNFLVRQRSVASVVNPELPKDLGPPKLAYVPVVPDVDASIGSPAWNAALEDHAPSVPALAEDPMVHMLAHDPVDDWVENHPKAAFTSEDDDGTEVQVTHPPSSDVLPFYKAGSQPPSASLLDDIDKGLKPHDYVEPEAITLSTLGLVKPDPATITDVAGQVNGDDFEVGLGTGVYKTGAPRR